MTQPARYKGVQTFDMNRERLAEHIEAVTRRMNAATVRDSVRRRRCGKYPK